MTISQKQSKSKFITIAITVTPGQVEYIESQVQGFREKSRWIRDAINMRMLAEADAQVKFSEKYKSEAFSNALEVAQTALVGRK